MYRKWVDLLSPSLLVSPLQLPGREERFKEPPLKTVTAVADAVAPVLASRHDGPYLIFGHSMGALIAFETALRLRAIGAPAPLGIVLAAHRAPHLPSCIKPAWNLPDDLFLAELRRGGGTPEEALSNPELLAFLMPALRADFQVCDTYAWEPGHAPLDIPFAVFGGLADPYVPRQSLSAWSRHTTRALTLRMFPGGHFFLKDDRDPVLAALTRFCRQVGTNP